MKKVCKIVLVFLMILNIYTIVFNVQATTIGDIWEIGKNFLDMGTHNSSITEFNSTIANNAFIGIIDFLWGLGILVVFISTIVLGIRYMLVNPNEKSRIKQATTPYLVGTIIILGALTIWRLMINVLEGAMLGR